MPSVTPLDLLDQLASTPAQVYPLELLTEIRARLPEMVPDMLEILAHAVIAPEDYDQGDSTWMLPVFSAFFLAEAKEKKAFPLLISLLHLPEPELDSLFGEMITEEMPNILACTFDGNEQLLRELVENPEVWEYARSSCGLGGYLCLLASGTLSLESVSEYFTGLMRGRLKDHNDIVWSNLVCGCGDLGLAHLVPDIKAAYEAEWCDPMYDSMENVIGAAGNGGNQRWMMRTEPITDTIAMTRHWACFRPHRTPAAVSMRSNIKVPQFVTTPIATPLRSDPKIGRNDPCPCGSGKKYKKCCSA